MQKEPVPKLLELFFVAGKTKRPDGLLLVTLVLAAAMPNRLGVIRLEDESQWMQAIQVSPSGS